jgi:hypothetical protein
VYLRDGGNHRAFGIAVLTITTAGIARAIPMLATIAAKGRVYLYAKADVIARTTTVFSRQRVRRSGLVARPRSDSCRIRAGV